MHFAACSNEGKGEEDRISAIRKIGKGGLPPMLKNLNAQSLAVVAYGVV